MMTCVFCASSYANPTKQLETAFATSLVLTDGDSITLGIGDFDPQTLFDLQHANRDEDSIALRKKLRLYSIPYTWQLDEPIYQHKLSLTGRVSYLNQSDFISLFDNVADDYISETVYNGMIGFNAEKLLALNGHINLALTLTTYITTMTMSITLPSLDVTSSL